jgi:hypothetical protein
MIFFVSTDEEWRIAWQTVDGITHRKGQGGW